VFDFENYFEGLQLSGRDFLFVVHGEEQIVSETMTPMSALGSQSYEFPPSGAATCQIAGAEMNGSIFDGCVVATRRILATGRRDRFPAARFETYLPRSRRVFEGN